ncbi:MAG TPA: PqqD family protein [Sulfurovum sp.]|jgi:ornithine carbamoyltransferase|nr:MAG: PqqD family protein [Sulfurovum sp. 35-42-20]OYY54682.1 MAG: PqqD family protein [Sulfurovum sp. 28-43-6]OYZ26835.1 MAG: PqqD family protein [Sulfurovum sp. 16-42-52]OYZ50588.1 MAG: PqqD family protein [Sulfurovum sp. 24-42-9]OZA46653.1 MAG: PqqD family protein [Sulfurovum sp. 17-42-90]OZA60512.1 MAG: PqqD family protein [Sulfurovum sp. 39-42-12]HQR73215.1 PqqD family protein [Sulfurovum sp.]
MDLSQKITFSQSVFAQEVDGEMVLLDMESENYFGLDEVGTAIWQAMQEHEILHEVFEVLMEQYEVEAEVLQNDLSEFVEKLLESGLVKVEAL